MPNLILDRENKGATPILPAHIEDTVRAIADLHHDHHRKATAVQRTVARMTSAVGRPRFVGVLTLAILAWVGLNLILPALGHASLDPPPFAYMQDVGGVLSLYVTSLILITQRHDEQLAEHRAQLTLELAIVSEQKSAKIIALLEEMRRDHPHLTDRVDDEAEAMARPANPQAVLDAIKDTHGDLLSTEVQITPT
ncbi:DUF1003 domain-containing protein [Methylobacterium sp. J-030]|uniref:DUF1003 domain-containing protein n=1 Tax=Methylobacterium sp. J-030 TaxID=2836627 RepID=UPI001FB98078|nr:DUF1003 domain-containing protein [Methylobacterium sp. J-030]MCJ2070911.1 DUF1003 domain-containing protein [Methylobacterium sp. J-030]